MNGAECPMMKWVRIAIVVGVVMLLAVGVLLWATRPSGGPGEFVLRAKTPFTKHSYFAYAQPWGGEANFLLKYWAPHADSLRLDLKRFPNNTQIHWRWIPIKAGFGPGVWGYDGVMYGNYDGGIPERPVKPVQVRNLQELHQSFAWTLSNTFGAGNVLTEFYLRSNPADNEAKTLEIGWLLHMPASSRRFFERAEQVGVWVDPQGRRWMVRIEDKFLMIAPEKIEDVRSGTIDMLAALRWLQARNRISGDEWVSGVGFGVEPVSGFGKLTIDRWSIIMR
jgi:hypothetical protein